MNTERVDALGRTNGALAVFLHQGLTGAITLYANGAASERFMGLVLTGVEETIKAHRAGSLQKDDGYRAFLVQHLVDLDYDRLARHQVEGHA